MKPARVPRLASGGRPTLRRVTNFYTAAFAKHRACNPLAMEYPDPGETGAVVCGDCGARWIIDRDSRGEPVGYKLLPALHPGLVDA